MIQRFIKDCRGVSSGEYALLIAIAGVGIGAAGVSLGNNIAAGVGRGSNAVHAANNTLGTSGLWAGVDDVADAGASSANAGATANSHGSGNSHAGGHGNAGGNSDNAHANAPGQNPGPGKGHSSGNPEPGTPQGGKGKN